MRILGMIRKVVIMGFFAAICGCGKGDGRYVSETEFQKNLAKQVALSPQTLQHLRKYAVTDQTQLKLEYFFYTDSPEKATGLAVALTRKGYSTEHRPSAGDKDVYIVTGWTTPLRMDEPSVVEWTRQMCQFGFEHDCDFDGWGTNPKQN